MKNYLFLVILWAVIAGIWIGLACGKIADGDNIGAIILNIFVAVLSVVNAVLNFINYKKSK